MPTDSRYRVKLKRWVAQTTEVIVRAKNPSDAVARACEYAKSGLSWKDDEVERGPAPAGTLEDVAHAD